MSIRLNIYGCEIPVVTDAVGSNSESLLASATGLLANQTHAASWLTTIVQSGHSFRHTREVPALGEDGGLLVAQHETEEHIEALYCLVKALRDKTGWICIEDASYWNHGAITGLFDELGVCGFRDSDDCPRDVFFRWFSPIIHGTPMFGDDFRTDGAGYAFLSNGELLPFARTLDAAASFERPPRTVPSIIPEHLLPETIDRLSENARTFATELSSWAKAIAEAEQDAFILWS